MSGRSQPRSLTESGAATASVDRADGTVPVSEFVRQFIRRHVARSQRIQTDLSLQPGGGGTSHNISLIPQSTRLVRQSQSARTDRTDSRSAGVVVVRSRRAAKTRARTGVAGPTGPREVPDSLGPALHKLWLGYCRTALDWPRIVEQAQRTPTANASVTNQLETVLRMNLVGARLKIVRSTAASLAGREGIVIMETKNLFRMVLQSSSAIQLSTGMVPLRAVPKQGTLFLLLLDPLVTESGLVFNGDQLIYRPVDRAVRKWRRPVLPMCGLGDRLPSTTEMLADLLCKQVGSQ